MFVKCQTPFYILPHVSFHLVLPVTQYISFATLQKKTLRLRRKIPAGVAQLASGEGQGYLTPEPRFLLLLLDFCFVCLFVYLWLRWVFVAACRLSLVAASRGYSLLRCTGFSLRWPLPLQSTDSWCVGFSYCVSQGLEHRLSSCGAWA